MSDRDLRSRALTVSFSDGPSMSVGSSLYRPNNSNLAGPLPQARQAYILSSSPANVLQEAVVCQSNVQIFRNVFFGYIVELLVIISTLVIV